MTWKKWLWTMAYGLVSCVAFQYVLDHHIQSIWAVLAALSVLVAGWFCLVNTVDLLFGRWIRRGRRTAPAAIVNVMWAMVYNDYRQDQDECHYGAHVERSHPSLLPPGHDH